MTIDTTGLTKNQIIAKIYEIVFECKIIRRTSHGYLIKYDKLEQTEYLKYRDMKDRLKNKQGCYIFV
jgi:hypothetical protein